jgi:hypothetical protein
VFAAPSRGRRSRSAKGCRPEAGLRCTCRRISPLRTAALRTGQVQLDDREYGSDETNGYSDVSLSGSGSLVTFSTTRVTSSSMPPPTEFNDAQGNGLFLGDYSGLTAVTNANPLWMDTRSSDVFLCPGTGTATVPPATCAANEANGFPANDQDIYTANVPVPGT